MVKKRRAEGYPIGRYKARKTIAKLLYLKTGEGWIYLAIVIDLYSCRIVGWHISRRMTTVLVAQALTKVFWMRKPGNGLIFHSDRGSQYTSKQHRKLLKRYRMRASIGDVGVF